MTPQQGRTTLTDVQLEEMLDRAAKRGAREALKAIGLDDEGAGVDIHELRTVLTAWRDTKREAWKTIVKIGVTAILGIMALGFYAWVQNNTGNTP